LTGSSDLVLCKTNGEAAHVSQVLFETDIPHYMKQSSGHRTLSSWIAKALCGNDGLIFLKEQFFSNATKYKLEDAETKWAVLKALDGHSHAPGLHMPELLSALARMDGLPTVCLNQANDNIVVSTVHRAKGSEAEHVYWLDSPLVFDNQQDQDGAMDDALKAAYVAATRAKTDIRMIEPDAKVYMKSINDSRWIQCGYSKSKKPYCKRIALFPDDVDPASFADTDAESRQSILSCIKPGDLVDLYPNEITKRFDIFFDGNLIGFTSAGFTDALFCGFAATNGNRNWPASIPNVFVTALTTVIAPDSSDVDEKYRTAGCWLGIELGGLPIIDWS
jgi:DNA helicase-2/ATP-dependent DNA helicase PcrA